MKKPNPYRELYEQTIEDTMCGRGDFWPTNRWAEPKNAPVWDNEQSIPIIVALQEALTHWEWPDARKWEHVLMATEAEAEKMAEHYEREDAAKGPL